MYPDRGLPGPPALCPQPAQPPSRPPALRGWLKAHSRGPGEGRVVLPGLTGELEIPPARSRKRLASRHILELLTPV